MNVQIHRFYLRFRLIFSTTWIGKPKIHTVSKPNQKQAKDAARNNPKLNTKPAKHSSDKGQKTHYHSTKDSKKMSGKDNIHYEDRSSKKNLNKQ